MAPALNSEAQPEISPEEQIYNDGRIAGLQEAAEFVAWLQRPESNTSIDRAFRHTINVFAERAKCWLDTIPKATIGPLFANAPGPPQDKNYTAADHTHFTLVFKGDVREFRRDPFMEETPFGVTTRVWIGDAVAEADRLRRLLRKHGINPETPTSGGGSVSHGSKPDGVS